MRDINKFYCLYIDNSKINHEFEIKELREKSFRGFEFEVRRSDGYKSGGEIIMTKTTEKDYDDEFHKKILKIEPVYKIFDFLQFHYDNFCKTNYDYELFITHIQYVILPKYEISNHLKTHKDIITNWLEKTKKMNLIQQEQEKNIYLQKAYEVAYENSPESPLSLSINPIELGKILNFSEQQTKRIVIELVSEKYLTSVLGMKSIWVTKEGLNYLRNMEKSKNSENQNGIIIQNIINSQIQFQKDNINSNQEISVNNQLTNDKIIEFFEILKKELETIETAKTEDFLTEIEYAEKQLKKGNKINQQLSNIGSLINDVGINFFANLLASPIFEVLKPYLGM